MRDRNRVTTRAIALLGVASLAALAACSSSGPSHQAAKADTSSGSTSSSGAPASTVSTSSAAKQGGSSSAIDVCSLMTASQASSINSVTYDSTKAQSPTNGYDICTYHNSGQHSSPIDIQDLTVTVASIPGCWSALQKADGPGKSIAGVGDAAFGAEIAIDVKLGDRCLTVSGLTDAELQGNYAPDIAMAKIIIAGLH
jgi:hypothetical protein